MRAETAFGAVSVDTAIGNLRELAFETGGRRIVPLHTAHWAGGDVPPDLPPVERSLAGDFFCAPFGVADVEPAPPHGWSANSHWSAAGPEEGRIRMTLDTPVMGAKITKCVRLSQSAPILYQSHDIEGGEGALTVAHHPMVRLSGRGRMSVSPKRAALTPDTPLEPGRNALACPARSDTLAAFPARKGGTIDLGDLPIAEGCEDFVTLVEGPDTKLGWTAIVREAEDDIVFFLKDPRVLPVTMLWHSNGGRDYAPWNGRHAGVLGIEDGCAAGAGGHRRAMSANAVSCEGVATVLWLGGLSRVRHAMGAVARPRGWARIADIRLDGATLTLTETRGADLCLPFDPDFFTETSSHGDR